MLVLIHQGSPDDAIVLCRAADECYVTLIAYPIDEKLTPLLKRHYLPEYRRIRGV